jgi:hypothetical protein
MTPDLEERMSGSLPCSRLRRWVVGNHSGNLIPMLAHMRSGVRIRNRGLR